MQRLEKWRYVKPTSGNITDCGRIGSMVVLPRQTAWAVTWIAHSAGVTKRDSIQSDLVSFTRRKRLRNGLFASHMNMDLERCG